MAPYLATLLLGADFEVDVDLRAVVELADGFSVALVAFELGVDFVVDVGEAREAVGAVIANDVGFYGVRARVGEVDDGAGNGIVVIVKNLAVEKAALLLVFLIRRS